MATTVTLIAYSPLGPAWLKGRVVGALICGTFGGVWMFQAIFFGGIATPLSLTLVSLVTVVAIAWPVMRLRSFRGYRSTAADRERWAAVKVPYWVNSAIEWTLCSVAAFWLARIGRYAFIPECLGVIIGLHFLPLGKMFRSPVYYLTGVVMVVGSLAALMLQAENIRNIAAFGLNGLVLWGTATVILRRDWLLKREEEN
jgi:hypothetical protein